MNIIGRLTRNAEVHTLSNDKQVVNFSVAVNDSYRNKQGERITQATYFDCAYWLSPKIAAYLTKGALVELTGRVSSRAWVGRDGEAHAGLNFHTAQIKLHSTVRATGNSDDKQVKRTIPQPQNEEPDLPF